MNLHELILNLKRKKRKNLPDDYTGSKKIHLNIPIPKLTKEIKIWCKNNSPNPSSFEKLLLDLAKSNIHEETLAIGKLLASCPKLRKELDCTILDKLLKNAEGWEEIDVICQISKFSAKEFLENRGKWENLLKDFNKRDSLVYKRASLVLCINFIRKLKQDEKLANLIFENILNLLSEDDKLITKAISWILREMIKSSDYYKNLVKNFVNEHQNQLKKHIVTEVNKKL